MNYLNEILKVRKERRVSVVKLAAATGIPMDRIYKWESGKGNPKSEDAKVLTEWLTGKLEEVQESPGTNEDLEQFVNLLQEKLEVSLERLSKDLHSLYNQQILTRAEIRGWGEYQVMKDAKNDENKRKALMEQINILIGENLSVDEKTGTLVLNGN